jgi:GNAT superfamily N-acetyltransferase
VPAAAPRRVVDCGAVPASPVASARLMTPDDVPAAAAVGSAALDELYPVELRPADTAARARLTARSQTRVGHLQETDPEGAWVAELDGEVVGVALAIVREGVWGLSLFGVRPGLQGQGIGGPLLEGALRTAAGCRGAIILSSSDPRAMRRYFRAGFRVLPCLAAAGLLNRSRIPAGLRSRPAAAEAEPDRATIDAASRHVRGASHAPDIPALLATGCELFVLPDRGWAAGRDGSPLLVAALDEAAAVDLTWTCLAAGEAGAPVHLDFLSQGNDWAVGLALDAGLALTPDGPIFARGELGPLAPYLPSGAYL